MNEPSFDRILAELAASKVNFILIGGLALGSWGVVRATKDVDVVAHPEPANLHALGEAAVRVETGRPSSAPLSASPACWRVANES